MIPAARTPVGAWLRTFRPGRTGACRRVCFPHAGGAASAFADLADALSPALDIVVVQYPGRQERMGEAPIDDVRTLADRVAEVLIAAGDGLLAVLGHAWARRSRSRWHTGSRGRGREVAGAFLSCHGPRRASGAEELFRRDDEEIVEALRGTPNRDSRPIMRIL